MSRARLWQKILEEALKAEAQAVHLESDFIRFKHDYGFKDAFELAEGEYEQLLKWLEVLGDNWKIKQVELKTEVYPNKAIVRIFKKNNRYLNNLKGLYFFENKEALKETLDYLTKKELQVISLEDHIELKPGRGLTAGKALDAVKADVIMVPHLEEEEILEAAVKKALTGKLVLVNKMVKDDKEALNYLLQQGVQPHLAKSIWQGIIK